MADGALIPLAISLASRKSEQKKRKSRKITKSTTREYSSIMENLCKYYTTKFDEALRTKK